MEHRNHDEEIRAVLATRHNIRGGQAADPGPGGGSRDVLPDHPNSGGGNTPPAFTVAEATAIDEVEAFAVRSRYGAEFPSDEDSGVPRMPLWAKIGLATLALGLCLVGFVA